MSYWKFSQKTKIKQKFFADGEKKWEIFFKTGTIVREHSELKIVEWPNNAGISLAGYHPLANAAFYSKFTPSRVGLW